MRFGKVFFFVLFLCFAIHAQTPKQIKILNNYGEIPFEDGKTIIAEVIFYGLDTNSALSDETDETTLTETEVLKILRQNQTTINAGEEFHGYKVAKAVKSIREWVPTKGYNRAEVVAFGEELPKNQMNLIFFIKRGDLARVSEIRFDGTLNISNEELIADFKKCSGDRWEIFNKRQYDYYLRKCSLSLIFSKGYFRAKIARVTPQFVAGTYIVLIGIYEGARFRYGEVTINGAKVFTEKEILEFGGLKPGEVANGKNLQNFVYEKLKRMYEERGYALYDAEFTPTFNEPQEFGSDATLDLVITVDEGPQFKLAKIEFAGIEKEKAEELRKLFSLEDGDIFNPSKIEDGVNKINELNEFQDVDKDADVAISTIMEEHKVKLTIYLRKLNNDRTNY